MPSSASRSVLLVAFVSLLILAVAGPGAAPAQAAGARQGASALPAELFCGPVRHVSGTITADTWWEAGYVYLLDSTVTVQRGATLRVAASVVKAMPGSSLSVYGKLLVLGTESGPRVLTSWRDDSACGDTNGDGATSLPAAGDWSGVALWAGSDPASTITRAVIRYSSGGAIRLSNVTPLLDHITFTKNQPNAVVLNGGTWDTATWDNTSLVHLVGGTVSIAADSTLTIVPGMKLKLAGTSIQAQAGGSKLVAAGTEGDPIVFTSYRDDTVCGLGAANEPVCDTNNDGSASRPAAGDWGSITFAALSSPDSRIKRAVVRYGGSGGGAVQALGASPGISEVRFEKNSQALRALDGAQPQVQCNDFEGNAVWGIYSNRPAGLVSAEGQWWGSASGPRHASNPGGAGDPASDGVDFTPWASAPCTHADAPKTWTHLYYLAGDSDVGEMAGRELRALQALAGNSAFNIAVMFDGPGQGDSRYYAIGDNVSFIDKGELNTGEPATLVAFVNWASREFPSDRTALTITDHGSLGGTAWDAGANDILTLRELGEALSQATSAAGRLDVLQLQACLMATVEVAYQVRNHADYLVASQNVTMLDPTALGYLDPSRPGQSPEALATAMGTQHASSLARFGVSYTISTVQLNALDTLVFQMNELSRLLKLRMPLLGASLGEQVLAGVQRYDTEAPAGLGMEDELIDLYDFAARVKATVPDADIKSAAQAVMTALQSPNGYVVYESHPPAPLPLPRGAVYDITRSHGVSIYFPSAKRSFYNGDTLEFAAGTRWFDPAPMSTQGLAAGAAWGPMLVEYVRVTNPNAPDNPMPPPLKAPQIAPARTWAPLVTR
jgi:hypothetical protein